MAVMPMTRIQPSAYDGDIGEMPTCRGTLINRIRIVYPLDIWIESPEVFLHLSVFAEMWREIFPAVIQTAHVLIEYR
jgi:hypothetical protein